MVWAFIVLILINIKLWRVTMAAIDNLNTAVTNLKATVDALVIPGNNDAAIQSAADAINTSVDALKAKVGQ